MTPEATFNIAKKLPHEAESFGRSRSWLDQYTGDLVQVKNTLELSLGDPTLRGIGQVIFVNNPVSGLLFLIAMFSQAPWLGTMSLLGTAVTMLF